MEKVNKDKPLVLVADDYEENRFALRLWLERRGYRVVEAPDGNEAVKIAIRERPALILMDISMPGVDGCAAMRLIRENEDTRNVPIVAVSAHEYESIDPLLRIDALPPGINEYVANLFDEVRLVALTSSLLSLS